MYKKSVYPTLVRVLHHRNALPLTKAAKCNSTLSSHSNRSPASNRISLVEPALCFMPGSQQPIAPKLYPHITSIVKRMPQASRCKPTGRVDLPFAVCEHQVLFGGIIRTCSSLFNLDRLHCFYKHILRLQQQRQEGPSATTV